MVATYYIPVYLHLPSRQHAKFYLFLFRRFFFSIFPVMKLVFVWTRDPEHERLRKHENTSLRNIGSLLRYYCRDISTSRPGVVLCPSEDGLHLRPTHAEMCYSRYHTSPWSSAHSEDAHCSMIILRFLSADYSYMIRGSTQPSDDLYDCIRERAGRQKTITSTSTSLEVHRRGLHFCGQRGLVRKLHIYYGWDGPSPNLGTPLDDL